MLFNYSKKRNEYLKDYIVDKYALFWSRQVEICGYTNYHKNMVELIESIAPRLSGRKMLECGIGTGYPFAVGFGHKGWNVSGVDIAPTLIKECKKKSQMLGLDINAYVGDFEALHYKDSVFDLVYCLQSTWYIADLKQAIAEMVRVTKEGSYIIFDIMNLHSILILRQIFNTWSDWLLALPKMIDRWATRGTPMRMTIWESKATMPAKVHLILRSLGVDYNVTIPETSHIENIVPVEWFHHRLVYICKKLK